jgi:hypothetical protein
MTKRVEKSARTHHDQSPRRPRSICGIRDRLLSEHDLGGKELQFRRSGRGRRPRKMRAWRTSLSTTMRSIRSVADSVDFARRKIVKIVCLTVALPRLKTGDYEEQCNPHHCWSRRHYYWGRSRLFGFRSWQAGSRRRAREVYRNVRRSQWQYHGDSRFGRFPKRPGQPGAKLEYASGSSQRRRKPDTSSRSFSVAGVSWNSAHIQDSGNSADTKQLPVHHARDTESRVK